MNDKSAFFKMPKGDFIAIVIFFVVSIGAFFPFVTKAMWNGLTVNSWLLSILALIVPLYNLGAAYLTDNNQNEK